MKRLLSFLFIIFALTSCSSKPSLITFVGAKTALGIDEKLMPTDATDSFSDGTKKIYCWFQWKNAQIPLKITARWTFLTDNIRILDYNFEIPRKDGFGGVSMVMPQGKKLPMGQYKVELTLGDEVLKTVNFSITASLPSYFVVTGSTSTSAGAANAITITSYDKFGNIATGYNGAHNLTFSGLGNAPDGTHAQIQGVNVGSPVSITFSSGVSESDSVKLIAYKAEGATLNVADGAVNSTGRGLGITVAPGAAHTLTFLHNPSTSVAGEHINPAVTVQVKDAYGNARPEDNSTPVTLSLATNPSNGTLSGKTTQNVHDGIASFDDLSVNKTGNNYTLTASSGSMVSAPSSGFNITAASARYFTLKGSNTMTAGTTNDLTITAYDQFDNVATGYNGGHNLTFSGPSASPNNTAPQVEKVNVGSNQNINFTSGVSNGGSAGLVAYKAESFLLNVSEGDINSIGHGLNVTVAASAPESLNFLQSPSNAVMKATIVPSVKVELLDIYGNRVSQDNTTLVSLALDTNPRKATLSGTLKQAASGGVAVFDDLNVNKPANGYTLAADSGSLNPTISDTFNIQ